VDLSNLIVQIVLVALWLGLIGALATVAHRITQGNTEIARKVVHIGTGNVILLAWWLQIPAWIGISAGVLAAIVALLSYKIPFLPGIDSVGRKSLGTFFYAVSIGALVAWFWPLQMPYFAALGILVMAWGDGLAGLIGQRFGRRKYELGGIKKSFEGSFTMALVSFAVSGAILLSAYGWQGPVWGIALGVALVATVLEAFSSLGIDNLTVPLGSAALAFWLSQLLGLA